MYIKKVNVTIVGDQKLVELLRPSFYGHPNVFIRHISPSYEAMCNQANIIEDADLLVLDSDPRIYSPRFFHVYGEKRPKQATDLPFINYSQGSNDINWNEEIIIKQNGLYNYCHRLADQSPKMMIIVSPDSVKDFDNSSFFMNLQNALKKSDNIIGMTDEQLSFAGTEIFWNIFSPIMKKGSSLEQSYFPQVKCTKYSPLESQMNAIKNWKLVFHSDFSVRDKSVRDDWCAYDKPLLSINFYAFSDDIIEKRNLLLEHLLSIPCIKEAFKDVDESFYRAIGKHVIGYSTESNLLLPWKKDILSASTIKYSHVLIHGESGTGKEATAEFINYVAFGSNAPKLKKVNCALIDTGIATSLLFGHKKGAFTGALEDSDGLIYNANGGALFLDEIHYLPEETLGKILRFMEDGVVVRLGTQERIKCKVKIIAATNSNVFMNNRKLAELGFFQRFSFTVYTLPIRSYLYDFMIYAFGLLWGKAIQEYKTSKHVEIQDCVDIEGFDLCGLIEPYHYNIGSRIDEFKQCNENITLTASDISGWHVKSCFMRCLSECYSQAWKNSNYRGIYNYILNAITSYALLNPDFIYERNVKNDSCRKLNPPGRKPAATLDEIRGLMISSTKVNGKGLQKDLVKTFGAYEKKDDLKNFLQRLKNKHKDDDAAVELIESLRKMLNKNGCYADYPN